MKKKLVYLLLIAGMTFLYSSCQYKFNVIPAEQLPDTTVTVYFSKDILPIWNSSENCVSCHNTGGQQPDLTPGHAYSDIFRLNLVDRQEPAQSIIYSFPHPETGTHTWKKYSAAEAATVLQWIEQGALNN